MGDETIYPADAIRWNERYESEGRQRQQGNPSRLLRAFAHLLPPTGLVLDAAAGVGVNALFVVLHCAPVQFPVQPRFPQQRLMPAALDNTAVLHHTNQIRIPNRTQPVGNDDGGTAVH
jgi:hypothetical protein